MTYAQQLLDALNVAASSVAADPRMGRAVRDAAADVLLEGDLIARMQASVALILALEDAEAAAKAAQDRAKAALLEAIGATTGSVRTATHTVSYVEGKPGVVITDDAAIPAEYMEQPPPRVDRARLAKALASGVRVPGAALRNGAPHLRISANAKKERAA